mgnify:CR=1 FL=1
MPFNKFIFILFFFIVGCDQKETFQKKEYIFGTIVDITIYGEDKKTSEYAIEQVFREFRRLHYSLHPWEQGTIHDINESIKNGKPFKIKDPEILAIIKHNQDLELQTHGYFNPAIGKLVEAWGFHSNDLPSIEPNFTFIENLAKKHPHMSEIVYRDGFLEFHNRNIQLDLGGYAKGYALDQAKRIFAENNIKNALINIGGNILALGQHGKRDWIVGIQDPRKPNTIASINLKSGWSIGTSGDYQRFFIFKKQRYSHLINPFTGFPSNTVQSVSILMPPSEFSGTLSDVYSKPLFIAPDNMKISIANELGINFYMIIMADGKIKISRDMRNQIKWHEKINHEKIIVQ